MTHLKKHQRQYFIVGILVSILLHIWLLIAFIHAKIPKPKHQKPLQIKLVQKGMPEQRLIPPSIPMPPQKPSIPKPSKPHNETSHKPSKHIRKSSTPKYEALPSNVLKSLPKSMYKPHIKTEETSPSPAISNKKSPTSTTSKTMISKNGERKANAKANLNLNIKQFVKKEESIYQYLSWLIRYLNKQARERELYPEEAKRLGLKGKVVVRVTINKNGTVDRASLRVVESSGYKILDESAPRIILELSPFRKPPRKITINLPVYFLINGYY